MSLLSKTELLQGIENREEITRVIDKAEQAIKTWEVVCTDFLSPPILAEVEAVFGKLTEVKTLIWGGYPQAERQRVGLSRPDIPLDKSQIELAALDIAGNFLRSCYP